MENYTNYLEDVLKEYEPQKVDQIKEALEMLVNAIQKQKPFNSTTNANIGGECR